MAHGEIKNFLEFSGLQMAAEAFLSRSNDDVQNRPEEAVIEARLQDGNGYASKFMPTQAEHFAAQYEVLTQYRNDPLKPGGTGFSGTLFRNRETEELTLSFRSTEFRADAARDNEATNNLELRKLGWGFGQIAEMEAWYAELRSDPALLAGKSFNVTGYSLSGHLATAFNILRQEEYATGPEFNPIIATYTFNGAGTGAILDNHRLTDLIAAFNRIRLDYQSSQEWMALSEGDRSVILTLAQDRVDDIAAERSRVAGLNGVNSTLFDTTGPSGDQIQLGYQVAALLVGQSTVPMSNFPFPGGANFIPTEPVFADSTIPNMIEIVGMEPDGLATSFVSNSGIHHGEKETVRIEAQPLHRGNWLGFFLNNIPNLLADQPGVNDFADTHSLVLIVDSLSVFALFEALDPQFTLETAEELFGAASSALAATELGKQGSAEGEVLERIVDALYELLVPQGGEAPLDYLATLDGNTWHESSLREPLHRKVSELQEVVQGIHADDDFSPIRIRLVSTLTSDEREQLRHDPGADGLAYRYALKELSPFVVLGSEELYSAHNDGGELGLYDPETGMGITDAYLLAREEMLYWKNQYFEWDGKLTLRTKGSNTHQFIDETFKDTHGDDLTLSVLGRNQSLLKTVFGGESAEALAGGEAARGDRLFGGSGEDSLFGNGGSDHLEGNDGADNLSGGLGNDVLMGGSDADTLEGGMGNDTLDGGMGFDVYYYSSRSGTDIIVDSGGQGRIEYDGIVVSGGAKEEGETLDIWRSSDRQFTYTLHGEGNGSTTLAIYGTGGTVFVRDFVDGALDISLLDAPEPPPALPPEDGLEIRADHAPQVFIFQPVPDTLPPGISARVPIPETPTPFDFYLIDELGNYVRDPSQAITDPLEFPFLADSFGRLIWGSDSADHLVAWDFGNSLAGFAGDDHVEGGSNLDFAGGGEGDDFMEGGAFPDMPLDAWLGRVQNFPDGTVTGAVDDVFAGGPDDDVIFGSTADDLDALLDPETPAAGHKGDLLSGDEGNDEVYGSTGDDLLLGGHGEDSIIGGPGNDVLDGDDAFSPSHLTHFSIVGGIWKVERGPSPFDVKFFPVALGPTAGNLWPYYKSGGDDDELYGGPGNDILIGMLGNDILAGEDGQDTLSGWEGGDRLLGGVGNDVMAGDFGVYEQSDDRLIEFSNYAPPGFLDSRLGHSGPVDLVGNDFLDGEDGNDSMYGEAGEDVVIGGDGNDQLWGDASWLPDELHASDYLDGGAGHDVLDGGGGDDVLTGGTGNDVLEGGEGSDTFVFARGDGRESISDAGDAGFDTLLVDYERDEAFVHRHPSGRIIITGTTGDEITISVLADGESPGIERIQFSDGSSLSASDFTAIPIDDNSIGGEDWSTFSDENETIDASDEPASDGFVMVDAGGGDDIVNGVSNGLIFGNAGNDTLLNGYTLLGGEGDDFLSGGVTLAGGPGNDRLVNGAILDGGPGDDTLEGGSGADRYFVNPGDTGADLILENDGSSDEFLDAYYRSIGITDWESRRDLTATEYHYDPGDNPNTFHSFEEVRAFFGDPDMSLEEAIAEGVEVRDPLPPLVAANDYTALETYYESGVIQPDLVEFGEGVSPSSLTFAWGTIQADFDPESILDDQAHSTLELNWGSGASLRLVMPNPGDPVGSGIEQVSFADGSLYSIAEVIALAPPIPEPVPEGHIRGTAGADTLTGSSADEHLFGLLGDDLLKGRGGNDEIQGEEGHDTLGGGEGDDQLVGGEGDDVYEFNLGDGADRISDSAGADTLVFGEGIEPDMVTLGLGSLLLSIRDEGDAIHIGGFAPFDVLGSGVIEFFRFADDTLLSYAELIERGFDIYGTQADDVISGTNVADRIDGLDGDDTLEGSEGDDTYFMENGNGSEYISDSGGLDTVRFGVSITSEGVSAVLDSGVLRLDFVGGHLDVRWEDGYEIEQFEFADGTVLAAQDLLEQEEEEGGEIEGGDGNDWLQGTGGNDNLSGNGGNDLLEGGGGRDNLDGGDGNDTLDGGADGDDLGGGLGNDTYLFGRGHAHDFINDDDETPGNSDAIRFGLDINSTDVAITADLRGSLHFIVNAGPDRLTVWDWLSRESQKIERVQFSDGTQWNISQIENRIVPAIASPFDDGLSGTDGNDYITGLGGNDEIFGAEGADVLLGGDGDDLLRDASGSGYLSGGAGNDRMEAEGVTLFAGGAGDDVFDQQGDGGVIIAINRGDGNDMSLGGEHLVVSLGGGIAVSDLTFERDRSNLILGVSTGESVLFENWYSFNGLRIASGVLQIIGNDIRTFDLLAVSREFDTAFATDPSVGTWSARDAMEASLLEVSVDSAIGGDIAYRYALHGNTDDLSASVLHAVLNDPAFGFTAQALTLFEEPGNRAPVLAQPIPDRTTREDESFSISLGMSTFIDPDGDVLSYSATLGNGDPLPEWLDFDEGGLTLSGTPGNDDVGIIPVRIVASDSEGLTASGLLALSVTNVNDDPVAVDDALGDLIEDTSLEVSASVLLINDGDIDGDTLTVISVAADSPLSVTLSNDGKTTIVPEQNYSGPARFTYTVSDGAGGTNSATVTLSVVGENDPPTLVNLIADQSVDEDSVFFFTLPEDAFADADLGDNLDFSVAAEDEPALPGWITFDEGTSTFSGTPDNEDVRTLAIRVIATDSTGANATTSFTVRVENTNDAPEVVQPVMDQSVQVGDALSFSVPEESFRDVDAEDSLAYSASLAGGSPLPEWLSFDGVSHTFYGVPSAQDEGTIHVAVTVTDEQGESASSIFSITISNPVGVVLAGTRRNDVLVGTSFDDVLLGYQGRDELHGLGGQDSLAGGRGNDRLFGDEGDDVLLGERGRDVVQGGNGDDSLDGGRGDDDLIGAGGHDYLYGGKGSDDLIGNTGNDALHGGQGKDWLAGGSGEDVLAGGNGADRLTGDADNDIYLHELDGGKDTITESSGADTLLFGGGISTDMVRIKRRHDDLLLDVKGGGGSVTIEDWYLSDAKKVETIQFADGTAWDLNSIGVPKKSKQSEKPLDNDDGYAPRIDRGTRESAINDVQLDESGGKRAALERDRNTDLLEAYLTHPSRHGFDALARDYADGSYHDRALSADEAARLWRRVHTYVNSTLNDQDEDTRDGAAWLAAGTSDLDRELSFHSFGHAGSIGASRGMANMKTLQGLEEGFQRLQG